MGSRTLPRRRWYSPRAVLAALVTLGSMVGCTSSTSPTLYVGAASSLVESLHARGRAFEAAHPGVAVEIIGDSSSRLARQLVDGAPYDVFISAREDLAEDLHRAGILAESVPVIVTGLSLAYHHDVSRGSRPQPLELISRVSRIGIADPVVPLGEATARWLATADLSSTFMSRVRSFEPNALAVAQRLRAGEVQLAIVYTQQCLSLPRRFHCMPLDAPPVTYVGAIHEKSSHAALAGAWLEEVGR